jgi:hypothetical protein
MARKKPAPIAEPSAEAPDPTFAELWDSVEPGSMTSEGVYSIFKTPEGGMHIAYRPAGYAEDQHFELPGAMMGMMIAAQEGKGPLGRLKAIAAARFA